MDYLFVLILLGCCSLACVYLIWNSRRANGTSLKSYDSLHSNQTSLASTGRSHTSSNDDSFSSDSKSGSIADHSRLSSTSATKEFEETIKSMRSQGSRLSEQQSNKKHPPAHRKTDDDEIRKNRCCHQHFVHHHFIHDRCRRALPERMRASRTKSSKLVEPSVQLVCDEQPNLKQSSILEPQTIAYTRHFCGRCHRLLNAISSTFANKRTNYDGNCEVCGQRLLNKFKFLRSSSGGCDCTLRNHCDCFHVGNQFEREVHCCRCCRGR